MVTVGGVVLVERSGLQIERGLWVFDSEAAVWVDAALSPPPQQIPVFQHVRPVCTHKYRFLITASSESNFSSCMSCKNQRQVSVCLSVCVICVFSLWSVQPCSGEVRPDGGAVAPRCGSGEQDWSRTAADEPPVGSAERSEVLRYRWGGKELHSAFFMKIWDRRETSMNQ